MVAVIGRRTPVTLPAPYAPAESSIGDAFSMLARPFADTLTPAVKRQKLMDMERESAGVEGVAAAIEAARNSGGVVDPYSIFAAGARGGLTGANVGDFVLGVTGNARGAADRATTNAAVASGKNYGGTYHGTQDQLANARTLQAMQEATKLKVEAQKPEVIIRNGVPTLVRRDESYGQAASVPLTQVQGNLLQQNFGKLDQLSPEQQKAVDALPPAEGIYNAQLADGTTAPVVRKADGFYHAQTNQRMPDNIVTVGKLQAQSAEGLGGSSLTNKIVERRVAHKQAVGAIDRLSEKLQAADADMAVGWLGRGANLFNDVRSQFEAAVRLKGGLSRDQDMSTNIPAQTALEDVFRNPTFVQRAQSLGIQSAVLRANIVDLAYTIAKAKDPGGRMSDQDINRAADIIGGSLMDPKSALAVLGELKTSLDSDHQIWEQEFSNVRGGGGAQSAQPAPAGGNTRIRMERGPDGQLRRVQ